jgi:hypothetical protein
MSNLKNMAGKKIPKVLITAINSTLYALKPSTLSVRLVSFLFPAD